VRQNLTLIQPLNLPIFFAQLTVARWRVDQMTTPLHTTHLPSMKEEDVYSMIQWHHVRIPVRFNHNPLGKTSDKDDGLGWLGLWLGASLTIFCSSLNHRSSNSETDTTCHFDREFRSRWRQPSDTACRQEPREHKPHFDLHD